MDQSYSESDVSLSPTKIFERLQMLRHLQIMQRGKLKKHFQYQDSPEVSSSVTEIVSHFSNSTSYNTFRSLLQSSQEIDDQNVCLDNVCSPKQIDHDYIEGVSMLNLSQESEFINNSPISTRSRISIQSKKSLKENSSNLTPNELKTQPVSKNIISLDEMPILSPKKDFEQLLLEKLQNENVAKRKSPQGKQQIPSKSKKQFLRRGEGMARFGLKKDDLVIQNTKALPWRKTSSLGQPVNKNNKVKKLAENSDKTKKHLTVQIEVNKPTVESLLADSSDSKPIYTKPQLNPTETIQQKTHICSETASSTLSESNNSNTNIQSLNIPEVKDKQLLSKGSCYNKLSMNLNAPSSTKTKHPLKAAKSHTWASVLTKEQDNFLRQLKQSDYYKNFVSPAKSTVSDSSCNDTLIKLKQDREEAEQNMFELLENKVTNESFNLNNSFFNRFLKKSKLECSGESTPLVLQKCLYDNPDLLHLHPEGLNRKRQDTSCSDPETCSDYTECSESCMSVSTCCTCNKVEPISTVNENCSQHDKEKESLRNQKVEKKDGKDIKENQKCQDDIAKNYDGVNAEMAEMNAKLIATSELLKDRLKELEDEIETFRKENTNLTKMREELDAERQKFYEDKTTFEQKYNEEKILSEYYLAEEKEKLDKQKQIYDRHVREMRGRLNKKDKDEVINLKKEISELKEEIRSKDAKSTSTIARLRNQIKIMEKEKKTLQEEVDKLQKENRRIQHSNDITRRLTNLKYLEQINKKLTHMSTKNVQSEVHLQNDIKYKAFEIERQSRCKKIQPAQNTRRRAKSVPNLNVTSRYAKYFSQKDSISDKDSNMQNIISNINNSDEDMNSEKDPLNESDFKNGDDSEDENNLEKIYNERFQSISPINQNSSNQEVLPKNRSKRAETHSCHDGFFIQKSNSIKSSKSLSKSSLSPYQANSDESSVNTSKSPVSILSHGSHRNSNSPVNIAKSSEEYININKIKPYENNRPKSPISILSNKSSISQKTVAGINKSITSDKRLIPSPEPSLSRTSVSKTNLNPTEIIKPDGSRELRFPNGNIKHISPDGRYSKFIYYNSDIKENFYDEGRIKYFYAETKTYHTTYADGLEVLEFSDGQVEKRYKDGSSEIRLPNGSVRYFDPKNEHVREEWRFPDGAALTVSASGEQRIVFSNGQIEVHAKDHKRREFPDGTVKLVYNDGTSETRYSSGRVRIKDKHGNLIMDSAPG